MLQSQGEPTDREKLDSFGGDLLAQSTKIAPATPLDIEGHRSTADAESSVAHVGNVKQLKDPDNFCHKLSAPDTCNSKAALVCDTVSGSNPITKDGSDPSSSSIPSTEDVDASVKGPSTGAQLGYVNEGEDGSPDIDEESGADDPEEAVLRERSNNTQFLNEHGAGALFSANPLLKTICPGNPVPLAVPELSTDSQCLDERKELSMKGKAASTVGEADAPDSSSPLPSFPEIESTSPVVPSPLPPAQTLPTSVPASQDEETEERPPVKRSPSLTFSHPLTSPSMISLAESYAESSHSYLKSLLEKQPKIKTRPAPEQQSQLQSQPQAEEPTTHQGFFSRFKKKALTSEEKKAWLSKVNPRNIGFLVQILGADKSAKKGGPPMKWDDFVNVMTDLDFEMKPKKGSEVQFKPPYQGLPKSTFHKPHPENTIDPITLQKWGKKLKDSYGWSEEMLPDLQSSARASMDLPRRSFEREDETPQ